MHRRFANPRQIFNINLHEIQLELLNEKCFFNKQHSSFTRMPFYRRCQRKFIVVFVLLPSKKSRAFSLALMPANFCWKLSLSQEARKSFKDFSSFAAPFEWHDDLKGFFPQQHAFFVFCLFCMCNMTFHSRNLSNDKRRESKKWNEFIGELLEIRAEWFIESAAFFSNPSALCRSDGRKLRRREDSWFSPSVRHY